MLLAAVAGALALAFASLFPPIYPRLHRIRKELLLLAGGLLGGVFVLEAGVRIIDPLGISYYEESGRYLRDTVPDPELVYRHAPNLVRVYQGVEMRMNSAGMREREIAPKKPDELRVLVLGDSSALGWGVANEQTFVRRLEVALAERLRRPVRTINAGVGGYNTVQEHAVFRRHAGAVDPDIVVLVYAINDTEENLPPPSPASASREQSPPAALQSLLGRSRIYRLFQFVRLMRSYSAPSAAAFEESSRSVQASMQALASINAQARERGAPFVTFFLRARKDAVPPSWAQFQDSLSTALQKTGREHAFRVVDMESWWGTREIRPLVNSIVDSHFNADGHAVIAAGMAGVIAEIEAQRSR